MVQKVSLGEVCGGKSDTRRGLWWKGWYLERFVLKKVALGEICCGNEALKENCFRKGGTRRDLWWKRGIRGS